MPEAALRALDHTVRRRVEGLLAGDHRAIVSGIGTELALVRPYLPGDDVRRIDWSVTARTAETHVRVDVAERAVTTWLLLDASPSMQFGTADRRKADVAEGVALAVGHLSTRSANRLAVITFGDDEERSLPPRQGRVGMFGLLVTLRDEAKVEGPATTSLGTALARSARLARQRGLVFIVSDFRGPRDWRRPLLQLADRHHVTAVEIRDPREQSLPNVGDLWLVDPETGKQIRVDTRSKKLRERFETRAAEERREIASELGSAGVDHVVLSTAGDWLRDFAGHLRNGGNR